MKSTSNLLVGVLISVIIALTYYSASLTLQKTYGTGRSDGQQEGYQQGQRRGFELGKQEACMIKPI